jgi:hypothetical protein
MHLSGPLHAVSFAAFKAGFHAGQRYERMMTSPKEGDEALH